MREEVAHVGGIGRHVVLCAGIEILFRAGDRCRDALVFLAQLPPCGVVVLRGDRAVEDAPAPFVDQLAEGQEGDLLQRQLHLRIDHRLLVVPGCACQANLMQVSRGQVELHGVADGLVEAVMRASLEQWRQVVVGEVVIDVSQLVVDRAEILFRRRDAHLDAHIAFEIGVPGAGVTDHVAITRAHELRALEERSGQGRHAQ